MKKRFVVISLHGYVVDYGIMEESKIIQEAKEMIEINKGQKIGKNYLSPIITNLPDLFILVWKETEYEVLVTL